MLYQAQLAAKLKIPEAGVLVDKALVTKQGQEEREGFAAAVAEAMAEVDIALAQRVLAQLQGDEKTNGLRRMVETLARKGSPEAVQAAVQLLESDESDGEKARFGFLVMAVELVPALGKYDPAAALALARRVTDSYHKPQALVAASFSQDGLAVRELLREAGVAALEHQAPVAELARIAIVAYPKFPDLSRESTGQAMRLYRERESRDAMEHFYGTEDDVQNLAIALAQYDLIAARELLEIEWIKLNTVTGGGDGRGYKRQRLVQSMANIDFERALQWARLIPERANGVDFRSEAFRQLSRWVLTAPEKRPLLWLKVDDSLRDYGN